MSLVVGIDIGNDNCVVSALNKNGVVDVVLNEASNRDTPLLIHFDKKQRFFGSAGASYAPRNPKVTFTQIKRLIGRRFDDPSFQNERCLLPYDTFSGPTGEIVVRVEFAGKRWEFTAVELLGMFLCHLRKSVKKIRGAQISECVLGVPSYLTIQQRKEYLLAAEIAGLKPLRLFHDGAATALEYALSRDLPYGKAIHVVFVDIGHFDTQVTVVKFCFGTLTVLAHSFDRDLGGRNFDNKIFEHLVGAIHGKHHILVSADAKASFKLRAKCADAKKVLSVNTEASVNIECLMNDIDVDETISRDHFENLSSELFKKIVDACGKALMDAGLPKEQIHSVELVGSGSRIPKIPQFLEAFFGQKMSRTLNGSECIANGCALQCGMLWPPAPIARTFGVHDIFPFPIGFRMDNNAIFEAKNIVVKGPFLETKTLTLQPSSYLVIDYADVNELPGETYGNIDHFKVTCEDYTGKLMPQIDSGEMSQKRSVIDDSQKHNLEIKFQFNLHGMPCIMSASLVTEGLIKQESHMGSNEMDIDGRDGEARKAECPPPMIAVEEEYRYTKRRPVKLSESICSSAGDVLDVARKQEKEMDELDMVNEHVKILRNQLEGSLFQQRTMILGSHLRFASKDTKDRVRSLLDDTEEWLYGTGADALEAAYIKKIDMLALAHKKLLLEHKKAEKKAMEYLYNLDHFASNIREKLDRGGFHGISNDVERQLSSKLHEIQKLCESNDLRPCDAYNEEINELKRLCSAADAQLKAKSEKSRQWSWPWSGSGSSASTIPNQPKLEISQPSDTSPLNPHVLTANSQEASGPGSLVVENIPMQDPEVFMTPADKSYNGKDITEEYLPSSGKYGNAGRQLQDMVRDDNEGREPSNNVSDYFAIKDQALNQPKSEEISGSSGNFLDNRQVLGGNIQETSEPGSNLYPQRHQQPEDMSSAQVTQVRTPPAQNSYSGKHQKDQSLNQPKSEEISGSSGNFLDNRQVLDGNIQETSEPGSNLYPQRHQQSEDMMRSAQVTQVRTPPAQNSYSRKDQKEEYTASPDNTDNKGKKSSSNLGESYASTQGSSQSRTSDVSQPILIHLVGWQKKVLVKAFENDTILDLKKYVERIIGTMPKRICNYAGRDYSNKQTIKSLGIQADSTLYFS